jgi:hypothetical protein
MMPPCASPSFVFPPVTLGVQAKRKPFVMVHESVASANYTIVAQNRDELLFPDNSPSISMWPYLLDSAQTRLLNRISIYAERGSSREQSRLLYMNASALRIWREMGMPATVIGESYRPARSAVLCFGMPFSE